MTTVRMFAAALLVPTLVLLAAAAIGSILHRRLWRSHRDSKGGVPVSGAPPSQRSGAT